MDKWTCKNSYEASNGARRVKIWYRDNGNMFRFVEYTRMPAGPEDEGALGSGYWARDAVSGIFGDFDACLDEARRSIPWLGATVDERKPDQRK